MWKDRQEDWKPRDTDIRTAYEVDYSRVIHSAALRRLQGKTQVYKINDSDFYRNRLTHSLEVGQIALGLKKIVEKDLEICVPDYLIHTISLLHDIGHPPFGHAGEQALNKIMEKNGGFEGNAQTLRIASSLECFSEKNGMNLTRRTLLGILKYPASCKELKRSKLISTEAPEKFFYDCDMKIVNWITQDFSNSDAKIFRTITKGKTKYKSLDCSIMDIADDITNAVHDLEDAISMKMIDISLARDVLDKDLFSDYHCYLKKSYPKEVARDGNEKTLDILFSQNKRKKEIGRLVGYLINRTSTKSQFNSENKILSYKIQPTDEAQKIITALKGLIMDQVIKSSRVQHLEFKGREMVIKVFKAFENNPEELLQEDTFKKYENSNGDKRIICDHIAGMTDRYLQMIFERMYTPGKGSIFDML